MHATQRIALALLAAAALAAGCNSDDIVAQRLDRPLTIDGDPSDWDNLIVDVDDLDFDFGYANDDEFLYLCVITDGDEVRRQTLAGGVYLWFDPAGGEERALGLHYPVGVATSLTSVALLSPGGSTEMPLAELEGVELNSLLNSNSLVVEMRIPLRSLENADLALGMDPAATTVGLELYVPEMKAPARPGGDARGGGRGSGPPRGKGGGDMGGGRGGGRGSGPPPGAAGADEIREHIVIPLALSSSSELNTSR